MIKRLKPKSEFSRNVLTLMTGTTIAQAIPIAISPILTRIYTPEDFGMFALYMVIVSTLAVIATGRYEMAIVLVKKEEDAVNIVILSLVLSFFVSICILLFVFVFNEKITVFFGNPEISNWIYFIPLSVFLTACYQVFNYFLNGQKSYATISSSLVVQSLVNSSGNLTFGFSGFSFIGFVLSNVLTGFSVLFFLFFRSNEVLRNNVKNISLDKVINQLKLYIDFPLKTVPQALIYNLYLQLPVLAIKSFLSLAILGFYSLAYRVVVTPLSIIANSLGTVYYQKASELYYNDKVQLYEYTKKFFYRLFFISAFVAGVVFPFLPDFFSFVFGDNWRESGVIAQYLLIYLAFDFALTPFSKIYLVARKNNFYLIWEVFRFSLMILFFVFLIIVDCTDVNLFFMIFSFINLLSYMILATPILNKKSMLWR